MKRIFSLLLALILIATAAPLFEVETEAILNPVGSLYYVTYSPGTGEGMTIKNQGPYKVGESITLPTAASFGFKKEGYYCTGWSIGKEGGTYTHKGTGTP
ncbi:MAG: hypothetical protein IJE28_05040, partial [Oscillospiraceae bacterium]|nr:hypothetical protein [Oscillospiraceae bacterium]